MICRFCRRRWRPRHDKCEGFIVGPTVAVACDCPCNVVPDDFEPPAMSHR